MEQVAATADRQGDFSGFLASYTGSGPGAGAVEPPWNVEGLADDVAILSYENALERQHRTSAGAGSEKPAGFEAGGRPSAHETAPRDPQQTSALKARRSSGTEYRADFAGPETPDLTLAKHEAKSASITIRLSAAECAQIRARAKESGLTVSAYLRSCTLEVEGLRKQVKEALAGLRPAETKTTVSDAELRHRSSRRWFARLWPDLHLRRTATGAG